MLMLIPFFLVYVRPNFVNNTESCLVLLKMAQHHGFRFGEIQHSLQFLPFGQNISALAEIFLKLLTSDVKKILKLLTGDVIVLNLVQTPTKLKYKFKNSVNLPKLQKFWL